MPAMRKLGPFFIMSALVRAVGLSCARGPAQDVNVDAGKGSVLRVDTTNGGLKRGKRLMTALASEPRRIPPRSS